MSEFDLKESVGESKPAFKKKNLNNKIFFIIILIVIIIVFYYIGYFIGTRLV